MHPPPAMRFAMTWRPYQQRVLDAVKEHLSDRRLHVVAAPGAGKTTLGLEIFRLLGHPALVLAPSRTIRDQWIARLCDFLPPDQMPPLWAGNSLDEKTYFTAITYQALHTKFRRDLRDDEAEDVDAESDAVPGDSELQAAIVRCRELGVRTLILDEAHHLRQEWWRALSKFKESLEDPVLVCLTATPPYDVIGAEWRRYQELCGSIDEEISVPELVRAGTLCPHQDYIWTCPPSEKDAVTAREHDERVESFMVDLVADTTLRDAVLGHPWVTSESPEPEAVLEDPEFAVAVMAFFQLRGFELPHSLLNLLDCAAAEVPKMDRRWWSALLKRYLFTEEWPEVYREHRDGLARRMRQRGLLYRRELRLVKHSGLEASLALSSAKLESCVAIHRLERSTRGAGLRQVILTDYIRDQEPDRLGAWPIFNRLLRSTAADEGPGIALVTGRVAMVHDTLLPDLDRTVPGLSITPAAGLPNFSRISKGGRATGFLTQCLGSGRIHTLVGTRSLLGEGWDCPAVNSLVLASFVGSFMTTNQMRGRAIRVDPAVPHKVASIWHLVAVDPTVPMGTCDLAQLAERFESFAGLHATRPVIESGLQRLMMGELSRRAHLEAWNAESNRRAREGAELESRWQVAVETGVEHRLLAAVESPPAHKLRSFVFANTLKHLLFTAASIFVMNLAGGLQGIRPGHVTDRPGLLILLAIVALLAFASSLPMLLKSAWIALRHVPVDGNLKQIGWALLDTLMDAKMITTPRGRLILRSQETLPGRFSITLAGGTYYEASLYADSLATLLGPIDNPRYIITRGSSTPWLSRRIDYHAVPPVLGTKKEQAEMLFRHWRRRVAPGRLIFTRTAEGRRLLLQARVRALSTVFTAPVHRRDRWC